MATTAIVARNNKRIRLVAKFAERRAELKKIVRDLKASPEDRFEAMVKLAKLPRNSAKVRIQSRCLLTGRANGVYSKFGLCRNEFRRLAHMGQITGVRKSSW